MVLPGTVLTVSKLHFISFLIPNNGPNPLKKIFCDDALVSSPLGAPYLPPFPFLPPLRRGAGTGGFVRAAGSGGGGIFLAPRERVDSPISICRGTEDDEVVVEDADAGAKSFVSSLFDPDDLRKLGSWIEQRTFDQALRARSPTVRWLFVSLCVENVCVCACACVRVCVWFWLGLGLGLGERRNILVRDIL